MCHHAYQVAIDFGFVAVDAIADFLAQEDSLALVKRMGFCDCGRLALDDDELARSALAQDRTSADGHAEHGSQAGAGPAGQGKAD